MHVWLRNRLVSDASTNLDSCFSKTVDLGGPPSKSQRQASCFLTEEQWRKSFKRQDYSICEICIHRVRALWKRARDSQAWDGTEEAAKIETNKKHIQEVKQDCVNGLCRKWVRGGLETKNSHQGKRKVEPVGHPENDLDLVTTGTVEDLSTSWDNAGRQFLAMIREYKKRKAADNGKAEPEKSLTLGNEARADLPLPRPFGLIGKTNPNFFITDLGRLDRAKRLEGSIRRHAKSVQDGRPLKADADPTRDIAFQVESSIHKSAKCLDTYLEGLKLFVKTLEDMKGGLLYEVKDGKLASVRCRKALCQIWKEPQSTVEQAAPATKPTIDLTSGEQEPKMSPEIKKEHKRKASDNADSGNPKRSRAKPGSALAGHPKAKSLK